MERLQDGPGGAAKIFLATLAAGAGGLFLQTAWAQNPGPDSAGANRPETSSPPAVSTPEQRRDLPPEVRRAIEAIHLPDAQKQEVSSLVEAYRQKELRARAEFLEQMKHVLSAEQYGQFEADMNRPPPPPDRRNPPRSDAAGGNPPPPRSGEAANPAAAAPATKPVTLPDGSVRVPVTFVGGYETDRRDGGRPVVLVAAGLGVPSDVFRKAFSNVTPASGGREPEPAQVRRNKETLMNDLGPYGVTNDLLDTVSNYYRYNGSKGEMWRNRPATAYAILRDGKVVSITLTDPGAGYSSPPGISVPGVGPIKASAKLFFGTDLAKNGSIKEISLDAPSAATTPAAAKP